MEQTVRKHIVVSAVNLRKGGTLTVLRECLQYLSGQPDLDVTALVHKRSLCDFPGIRYVEIPWSIRGWGRRLWCEYVTMHRISKSLPETDLWLSLHDTTPRVRAKRQAVYCHTSFPFLKVHGRDFRMDPKIPLFALLTRFAYRIGVHRNRYLIVQQNWFREGLSSLLHFPAKRIIVAPPHFQPVAIPAEINKDSIPLFFFPSTPDCHKNFETVCQAAALLEKELGPGRCKVVITVNGSENRYAAWLKKQWGHVSSIDFHGFMSKEELSQYYGLAACLVFPSRVETWGLPISEFMPTGKPMLLADLPYAHETAAGAGCVAFFPPEDASVLARHMMAVIRNDRSAFSPVPPQPVEHPHARDWHELFSILLNHESTATR